MLPTDMWVRGQPSGYQGPLHCCFPNPSPSSHDLGVCQHQAHLGSLLPSRDPPTLVLLAIGRVAHVSRDNHANDHNVTCAECSSALIHPKYSLKQHVIPPITNAPDRHSTREREREHAIPKINPTSPLIKSKILAIKSLASAKTDWKALRMVLKIFWKTPKMEEMRLPMLSTIEAMVIEMKVEISKGGLRDVQGMFKGSWMMRREDGGLHFDV